MLCKTHSAVFSYLQIRTVKVKRWDTTLVNYVSQWQCVVSPLIKNGT